MDARPGMTFVQWRRSMFIVGLLLIVISGMWYLVDGYVNFYSAFSLIAAWTLWILTGLFKRPLNRWWEKEMKKDHDVVS